jgi:hypothetical protein
MAGDSVRVTIRFPSGVVEHRYGSKVPALGDKLGREGDEGIVTSVEYDVLGHYRVRVDTSPARPEPVAANGEAAT